VQTAESTSGFAANINLARRWAEELLSTPRKTGFRGAGHIDTDVGWPARSDGSKNGECEGGPATEVREGFVIRSMVSLKDGRSWASASVIHPIDFGVA